jgi:hypothetical protein
LLNFLVFKFRNLHSEIRNALFGHFHQPVEIRRRPLHNGKADDFRDRIGVKGFDFFLQFLKPLLLCFDDQQPLLFVPDLSFPSIDGADWESEIDTGGQMFFNQSVGNLQCLLFRTTRNQHNNGFRHRFREIRNPCYWQAGEYRNLKQSAGYQDIRLSGRGNQDLRTPGLKNFFPISLISRSLVSCILISWSPGSLRVLRLQVVTSGSLNPAIFFSSTRPSFVQPLFS